MKHNLITIGKAFQESHEDGIYELQCLELELRDILTWQGEPLKPEWKEQIIGQKKLAKEILGDK